MAAGRGQTRPVDVVPLPAALFGPLLERVTDVQTLRCALRAIFVLHRKQGRPSVVTARELADDPVLGLRGDEAAAERELASLAAHGLLLQASMDDGGAAYCLDTPANRRTLSATGARTDGGRSERDAVAPLDASVEERPNVFRIYEENIGVITPMAAELLKDMEAEYPPEWIAEAFGQAVLANARNLRYIEAVLRRWRDDGRGDGTAGGRAGSVRASEIVRRPGR